MLEESHAGDLDEPQELLDSLKGMMASFCWQVDKRMSGYEPGMIVQSAEFGEMAEAFALNVNDYTEQVEPMETAREHEQYRKEVEFRIDNGIMKILYGVGCVVTGVCAILATGGAATPLVVMSWAGATGATVYGLSEIGEGVQSYELGQMGDVDTETFNFGRDVLCGGDEKLYHTLGVASVALCDIASFGADISDALSFFRKGGSGGGFIDDITEHLTKGMDGVDDVVDGAIDAVPNMSAVDEIAGLADDVPVRTQVDDAVVNASDNVDEVLEGHSDRRNDRRNETPPETDEVEELYERIYDQQYEVCEEYEDYLDEIREIQRDADADYVDDAVEWIGESGSKTIKDVEAPILPEGSPWERNVLNSFAGGKSNSVTYEGGTTLYRVGGKNGGFWSLDPPPATEYQWRVDTAIKQEFCNDASTLYKMTIPEGATLSGLEGKVGSQGMGLYGGAHQVYIDYKAVPSDWIEITPMQWK